MSSSIYQLIYHAFNLNVLEWKIKMTFIQVKYVIYLKKS